MMESAALHEWVERYNWDDGLAPIWAIAENPRTEFATALLIYWRLGGPWLAGDADGANAEAQRLQDVVRARLLGGHYLQGSCRFDPTAELSRTQLFKLRKAGLPELLLGTGIGD